MRQYFTMNENENTIHLNLWDVVKTVHGETFMTLNAYSIKDNRSQINTNQ